MSLEARPIGRMEQEIMRMKAVRTILAGLCVAMISGNVWAALGPPEFEWSTDVTLVDPGVNFQGSLHYLSGAINSSGNLEAGQTGWGGF